MSEHKHATDRSKALAIAQCPLADDESGHLAIELETEGKDDAVQDALDTLRETWAECGECGRELEFIAQTTPTEVLD